MPRSLLTGRWMPRSAHPEEAGLAGEHDHVRLRRAGQARRAGPALPGDLAASEQTAANADHARWLGAVGPGRNRLTAASDVLQHAGQVRHIGPGSRARVGISKGGGRCGHWSAGKANANAPQ